MKLLTIVLAMTMALTGTVSSAGKTLERKNYEATTRVEYDGSLGFNQKNTSSSCLDAEHQGLYSVFLMLQSRMDQGRSWNFKHAVKDGVMTLAGHTAPTKTPFNELKAYSVGCKHVSTTYQVVDKWGSILKKKWTVAVEDQSQ